VPRKKQSFLTHHQQIDLVRVRENHLSLLVNFTDIVNFSAEELHESSESELEEVPAKSVKTTKLSRSKATGSTRRLQRSRQVSDFGETAPQAPVDPIDASVGRSRSENSVRLLERVDESLKQIRGSAGVPFLQSFFDSRISEIMTTGDDSGIPQRFRIKVNSAHAKTTGKFGPGMPSVGFPKRIGFAHLQMLDSANEDKSTNISVRLDPDLPEYDGPTYARIGNYVVKFFNTFCSVLGEPPTNDAPLKLLITDVAVGLVCPVRRRINAPRWEKRRGWGQRITFIDENTGEKDLYSRFALTGVHLKPSFPGFPPEVPLIYYSTGTLVANKMPKANGKYISVLPDDFWQGRAAKGMGKNAQTPPPDARNELKARLQDREEFERYMVMMVQGVVTTKEKIRLAFLRCEAMYTSQTKDSRRNHRGGKGLTFKVRPLVTNRTIIVMPKQAIKYELDLITPGMTDNEARQMHNLPTMYLYSLDSSWLARIYDVERQTFQSTMSAVEAFRTVAGMLDSANVQIRSGIPPPSSCACDHELSQVTNHYCASCSKEVLCASRERNRFGLLVCPNCIAKDAGKETLVTEIVVHSVRESLRQECSVRGIEFASEEAQKHLEKCLADVQRQLADHPGLSATQYSDKYAGNAPRDLLAHNFHPSGPTVDAVHPGVRSDLGLFKHVEGNLAITSVGLNFGKYTHVLASIAEIGRFYQQSHANAAAKQLAAEALIARCKEIAIVAAKGRAEANRSGHRISAAHDTIRKYEFTSGRLHPSSDIALFTARHTLMVPGAIFTPRGGWTREQRKTIQRIGEQIARKFQKPNFPHNGDGCPWFGQFEPMPPSWSWDVLFAICSTRLHRMKFYCNRHWVLIDNEITTALELLYQAYTDEEEYAEFLGLPLSVYTLSPLTISIAHKHHGRQMRTGWPENPTSLSDRDNIANNILIESQFTNFLKRDFPESTYPDLQAIVASIEVPRKFYDPTLPAPAVSLSAQEASQLQTDDDLDFIDDSDGFQPWSQFLTASGDVDEDEADEDEEEEQILRASLADIEEAETQQAIEQSLMEQAEGDSEAEQPGGEQEGERSSMFHEKSDRFLRELQNFLMEPDIVVRLHFNMPGDDVAWEDLLLEFRRHYDRSVGGYDFSQAEIDEWLEFGVLSQLITVSDGVATRVAERVLEDF
jgi:hypothetical protein